MMGFWGSWSLAGIHFFNILFSYYDDILLREAHAVVIYFYSKNKWYDNVVPYTIEESFYDQYPLYFISFVTKTLANIGIIVVAINYYDGWREHSRYLHRKYIQAEYEKLSDSGEDLIAI